MVSGQVFWTRVGVYNETMLPIEIAMIAAAAFLVYRVFFKPGAKTDVWTKIFLSFAFAWNAVVFFPIFMRNPISILTGVPLFVAVAILFTVDIFAKKTQFRLPTATWKKSLTSFWILLVFLYPLLGWPLGHVYPKTLLPMFPCPLTVFAIALVAAATPNVDKKVFILLLPWALMGLPKCFGALDCYEDCILFASGVYGLIVLIRNWKVQPSDSREERLSQHGVMRM